MMKLLEEFQLLPVMLKIIFFMERKKGKVKNGLSRSQIQGIEKYYKHHYCMVLLN